MALHSSQQAARLSPAIRWVVLVGFALSGVFTFSSDEAQGEGSLSRELATPARLGDPPSPAVFVPLLFSVC